jgi:hypothetical protein
MQGAARRGLAGDAPWGNAFATEFQPFADELAGDAPAYEARNRPRPGVRFLRIGLATRLLFPNMKGMSLEITLIIYDEVCCRWTSNRREPSLRPVNAYNRPDADCVVFSSSSEDSAAVG